MRKQKKRRLGEMRTEEIAAKNKLNQKQIKKTEINFCATVYQLKHIKLSVHSEEDAVLLSVLYIIYLNFFVVTWVYSSSCLFYAAQILQADLLEFVFQLLFSSPSLSFELHAVSCFFPLCPHVYHVQSS